MKCKSCGLEKDPSLFYVSNKSRCKDCVKESVKSNRKENIEHYREYDRVSGNRQPESYAGDYRQKYPNKYSAHILVGNSLRDGKLERKPCESCGRSDTVHAHHDDYLKPLDVRWLCAAHHRQWHVEHGQALNA